MDLGLGGARVLISGGSAGMGLSAGLAFAADGAKVAVLARDRGRLDDAAEKLSAAGSPEVITLSADLTDGEQVKGAFQTLSASWPHLNTLVNAAGPVTVGVGGFEGVSDEEWLDTMNMGVVSAARCVRAALPLLRSAPWARIVNVSAHSTRRQSPDLPAYTASKAALTSLSKNLSQSLASERILVNTVSPGSFLSPGLKHYLESLPAERNVDPDSLEDAMRVIIEDFGHPAYMRRAGDPSEIGPVIAFVGSRVNSYMTGADINVDGGSDF